MAWRAFKTGSVRATTWRSYGPALNALTHYLGDRRVNALTEDHFVEYRQARLRGLDWKTRSDVRPLKPTTINAHLDRPTPRSNGRSTPIRRWPPTTPCGGWSRVARS